MQWKIICVKLHILCGLRLCKNKTSVGPLQHWWHSNCERMGHVQIVLMCTSRMLYIYSNKPLSTVHVQLPTFKVNIPELLDISTRTSSGTWVCDKQRYVEKEKKNERASEKGHLSNNRTTRLFATPSWIRVWHWQQHYRKTICVRCSLPFRPKIGKHSEVLGATCPHWCGGSMF